MKLSKARLDLGLTGDREIQLSGEAITARRFVRAHILEHAADFGGAGEWAFFLNVQVLGRRDANSVKLEYLSRHPASAEWGTNATARMTGIPLSISPQKLARGEVQRTGVMAPEACFDPQSFFAELARRGIVIECQC